MSVQRKTQKYKLYWHTKSITTNSTYVLNILTTSSVSLFYKKMCFLSSFFLLFWWAFIWITFTQGKNDLQKWVQWQDIQFSKTLSDWNKFGIWNIPAYLHNKLKLKTNIWHSNDVYLFIYGNTKNNCYHST